MKQMENLTEVTSLRYQLGIRTGRRRKAGVRQNEKQKQKTMKKKKKKLPVTITKKKRKRKWRRFIALNNT